ncbi:MAG TPA: metallophosphoesterase [Candidatus Brocadiia bacterium]|nr:metallophosphoesterase [Candidatus Brocadiia bacterium]
MKRLIYFTDTHIGAGADAWGQQPTCAHLLPQLLSRLREWLIRNPADLVLHGGDCTDAGNADQRRYELEFARSLPVPFRICLGNHDLRRPDSLGGWLSECREFFGENATSGGDYVVDLGPAALIVLTTRWQRQTVAPGFHWPDEGVMWASFSDEQYEWLENRLERLRGRPAILAMHETLNPLPPRLTGLTEAIHAPPGPHIQRMRDFINSHPQVRLVLSGHCHATCATRDGGCVLLTTSAFFEPPFQVRVITVSEGQIEATIAYPIDIGDLDVRIDEGKRWSAGQWEDWTARIPI